MNDKEKSIVITSALRTAIGKFNGSLKKMHAHELGSIVVKENLKKSTLKRIKPWMWRRNINSTLNNT